jgi:hypothetical protein
MIVPPTLLAVSLISSSSALELNVQRTTMHATCGSPVVSALFEDEHTDEHKPINVKVHVELSNAGGDMAPSVQPAPAPAPLARQERPLPPPPPAAPRPVAAPKAASVPKTASTPKTASVPKAASATKAASTTKAATTPSVSEPRPGELDDIWYSFGAGRSAGLQGPSLKEKFVAYYRGKGVQTERSKYLDKVWSVAEAFICAPSTILPPVAWRTAVFMVSNYLYTGENGESRTLVREPKDFPDAKYDRQYDQEIEALWTAVEKKDNHVKLSAFKRALPDADPDTMKKVFAAASCANSDAVEHTGTEQEQEEDVAIGEHCFKVGAYVAKKLQEYHHDYDNHDHDHDDHDHDDAPVEPAPKPMPKAQMVKAAAKPPPAATPEPAAKPMPPSEQPAAEDSEGDALSRAETPKPMVQATFKPAPKPEAPAAPMNASVGDAGGTKNIYGQALEPCATSGPAAGSAQEDGKCDEKTGEAIHSMCVTGIPADFSSSTGQGPWSSEADNAGRPWCVCIGAWSTYQAKQKSVSARCEAVPDFVLGESYLNHWNTWKGNELPDQIVVGVNALYSQCAAGKSGAELDYLQSKYCSIAMAYESTGTHNFKTSKEYSDAFCDV